MCSSSTQADASACRLNKLHNQCMCVVQGGALHLLPCHWVEIRHLPRRPPPHGPGFSCSTGPAPTSSSTSRGGFLSSALAKATRCFSPPLRRSPRSPTTVS
jgi:hypothetical protein